MACTLSYTFDLSSDKKFLKFRAENGEEYCLLHELTWTIYGSSILNISIECNIERNVLIMAQLCTTSNNPVTTSSLLEECRANLHFQNVNFLTPDPWRCVISVIPHTELHDLQESTAAASVPTPSKNKGLVKRTKLEQLSADMQRLLISGDFSDVVLSDGVNKIHAHKVVLSARSPVFAKMFLHPMKENSENCVMISDVPDDALKELVSFIYTGNVTLKDAKMARNLYMAADKYAVTDLRKVCSDVMQNVSSEDVLDTLILANLYEDIALKHSALEFISKNYSQLKNSQGWESFMKENQGLAIEILSFIIENKS